MNKLLGTMFRNPDGEKVCTSATSLSVEDQFVTCTGDGSNAFEITLPSVAEAKGRFYFFYRTNASTGTSDDITIAPNDDVADNFGIILDAAKDVAFLFSTGKYWIEIECNDVLAANRAT